MLVGDLFNGNGIPEVAVLLGISAGRGFTNQLMTQMDSNANADGQPVQSHFNNFLRLDFLQIWWGDSGITVLFKNVSGLSVSYLVRRQIPVTQNCHEIVNTQTVDRC